MESLWMDEYEAKDYPRFEGTAETDTVVIGGGLAGVLCAYLLKQRGIDCILLEAKKIGLGVTGNTTAKITAQHGLVFSKLESSYGLKTASEYLLANQDAVNTFKQMSKNIACGYEEKTAYVYSKNNLQALEKELEVYRKMGVEPVWKANPPIPVKTVGALGMQGQGQFNPLKFLGAVAHGLNIYEQTFAEDIKPGKVITDKGVIHAKNIVLATHFPMVNIPGLYFMKLYQHRSYVIALQGAQDPDGMFIDEQEGGFSFRSYKDYVLLGGGGHHTGVKSNGWEPLRNIAKVEYPKAEEKFAWATQDCMSLDALPYIGHHRKNSRHVFVASGFNKWGMTGSMTAAKVISDLISEGSSQYSGLFDPSRSILKPQLFANAGQSILGLISLGKRCPHMGCALRWNPHEHSWDCPCHGSRFDKHGNVTDNPAKRGISIE